DHLLHPAPAARAAGHGSRRLRFLHALIIEFGGPRRLGPPASCRPASNSGPGHMTYLGCADSSSSPRTRLWEEGKRWRIGHWHRTSMPATGHATAVAATAWRSMLDLGG